MDLLGLNDDFLFIVGYVELYLLQIENLSCLGVLELIQTGLFMIERFAILKVFLNRMTRNLPG